MNRFLKKEWDDTPVSEDDCRRARNRAWSRFHAQPQPVLLWRGIAVASGVVAIILLRMLMPTPPTTSPFEGTPAPLPEVAEARPTASIPTPESRGRPVTDSPRPASAKRRPTRGKARTAAKAVEAAPVNDNSGLKSNHLVLNFRLPESGVRMIWVQDADFYRSEGETQ